MRIAPYRALYKYSNRELSGQKGCKKAAAKLNSLLQRENLPAVRIVCKPLPGNFTVSQKYHLHTQAICDAGFALYLQMNEGLVDAVLLSVDCKPPAFLLMAEFSSGG